MATTIAQLKAIITADTADAETNIKRVGTAVSDTKDAMDEAATASKTATDTLRGAFSGLGNFMSGAFSGALDLLKGITPEILRVVGDAQSLEIALATTGGNAQELAQWMGDLKTMRGYDDQDIKDWYLLGLNLGFTSDQTQELISGLADMGVVMDKTPAEIEQMIKALGQMNETGVLGGRVMNTLGREAGSLRGVIADAFAVPTTAVDQLIEDGLITSDKALELYNDWLTLTYKQPAIDWEKTIPGMESRWEGTSEAWIEQLTRGAVEALLPAFDSVLGALSGPEAMVGLQTIGKQIGASLTTGVSAAGFTLDNMFAGGALGGVSEFIERFKSGDFGQSISQLVGSIEFGVMSAGAELKAVGLTLWDVGLFVADTIRIFVDQLGGFMEDLNNRLGVVRALQDWSAAGGATNILATVQLGKDLIESAKANSGEPFAFDFTGVSTSRDELRAKIAGHNAVRDASLAAIQEGWDQYNATEAARLMAGQPVTSEPAPTERKRRFEDTISSYPVTAMASAPFDLTQGMMDPLTGRMDLTQGMLDLSVGQLDLTGGVIEENAAAVADAMRGALVEELANTSGDDPKLLKAMLSGAAATDGTKAALAGEVDLSAFMPEAITSLNAMIGSNKAALQSAGASMFENVATGFVNSASASLMFQQAIDAMVMKSLEGILGE